MAIPDPRLLVAFNRFGLGPRPGDFARTSDPREAILAELNAPQSALLADPALQRTPLILQAVYADEDRKKQERDRLAQANLARLGMPAPNVAALIETPPAAPPTPAAMSAPAMTGAPAAIAAPAMTPQVPVEQQIFRAEATARFARACAAPIGFVERLVAFWSNHFCISLAKSNIGRACAGAFEREAIRPYVTGRFADMLRAVEQHPGMLNFLDNAQSIGPNSKAGQNRKRGLNENLAREILELHTMGVGSGYSQTDVTQLAQVLTGWTIVGREGKLGEPGAFAFNPNAHEPGTATLLGRVYAQDGVAQGEAALADIARQGATAAHIAKKIARHFVADDPDPALVARLAKLFRDSEGDLGALAHALVMDEAAWSALATKIRNPWEIVVASQRAFNRPVADPGPALNAMNLLGMPLWQPGGPNGFSDDTAAWASPEGMKMRLELAAQFARQTKDAPAPAALVDDILGPTVSPQTREAVTRAESREQAFALLIMSPEFQRR
ncbi:DUF1800 family protein [Methylocapsa sp. S129]|uniref:DUF1800 domain-containing protein n=1 Tax=Methylocapsa sp. S129 TaxID=1641869 RepID=UPI00131D7127|nr:DUF1800 family protein [Methylocapsa sp. S129]